MNVIRKLSYGRHLNSKSHDQNKILANNKSQPKRIEALSFVERESMGNTGILAKGVELNIIFVNLVKTLNLFHY